MSDRYKAKLRRHSSELGTVTPSFARYSVRRSCRLAAKEFEEKRSKTGFKFNELGQ